METLEKILIISIIGAVISFALLIYVAYRGNK